MTQRVVPIAVGSPSAQQRIQRSLKALMADRELTTRDLGEILECGQSAAAMKLRGARKFSVEDLEAVAHEHGLEVDDLLNPARMFEILAAWEQFSLAAHPSSQGDAPPTARSSSARTRWYGITADQEAA